MTETWLKTDIDSDLIKVDGFTCVRGDRANKRGGGTAIYVRDGIPFSHHSINETFRQEAEGVLVYLPLMCIAVICVYIPPSLSSSSHDTIRDNIVNITDDFLANTKDSKILLAGDFNNFPVSLLASDLDLLDIVREPTRGSNVLDHILIDRGLLNMYHPSCVSFNPPIGRADHKTLVATPLRNSVEMGDTRRKVVYDFRASNLANLLQKACEEDWSNFLKSGDIDAMCTEFTSKIHDLIDSSIPQKLVSMKGTDKAWITPVTKVLINEKWSAYRSKNWARYNHLKNKVRTEIIKAKDIWARKLKKSTYGLWRLTKSLSGKSSCKGSNLSFSTEEPAENAAERIAVSLTIDGHPTVYREADDKEKKDVWNIQFSEENIARRLRKLPKGKATGSDRIPNKVYSLLADVIAAPLKAIFEYSIKTQTLPSKWKEGLVVPIPKSYPPQADKLRMITLLSSPSKILERLVLESLMDQLLHLFGKKQHAFRKNCSTATALIQIIENATNFYDDLNNFGLSVISFDLSKAFDRVDHGILLEKLRASNLPSSSVRWIQNYLTDRTIRVRVQDAISSLHRIHVGVPQGSVLGPALFCIMAGDFTSAFDDSHLTQYADDLTIVKRLPTSNPMEIQDSILEEVNNFKSWCERNKQQHNDDKSQLLICTRTPLTQPPNLPIAISHTMKILGVCINDRLTWSDHIYETCKKASKRLRILRVLKPHVTSSELHEVYASVVRSVCEYCFPLFVGLEKGLSTKLQRIDKRAHRIMQGFCSCSGESLRERREKLSIGLLKRYMATEDHILREYLPQVLPSSKRLANLYCRTERRRRTFFPYTAALYNQDT